MALCKLLVFACKIFRNFAKVIFMKTPPGDIAVLKIFILEGQGIVIRL